MYFGAYARLVMLVLITRARRIGARIWRKCLRQIGSARSLKPLAPKKNRTVICRSFALNSCPFLAILHHGCRQTCRATCSNCMFYNADALNGSYFSSHGRCRSKNQNTVSPTYDVVQICVELQKSTPFSSTSTNDLYVFFEVAGPNQSSN
jgi:hypothetical protein